MVYTFSLFGSLRTIVAHYSWSHTYQSYAGSYILFRVFPWSTYIQYYWVFDWSHLEFTGSHKSKSLQKNPFRKLYSTESHQNHLKELQAIEAPKIFYQACKITSIDGLNDRVQRYKRIKKKEYRCNSIKTTNFISKTRITVDTVIYDNM